MKIFLEIILLLFLQSCISIKNEIGTSNNCKNEKTNSLNIKVSGHRYYFHRKIYCKENDTKYIERRYAKSCRCLPQPGKYITKTYENGILINKEKELIDNYTHLKKEKIKTFVLVNKHKRLKEKLTRSYNGAIVTKHLKTFDESGKLITNENKVDTIAK